MQNMCRGLQGSGLIFLIHNNKILMMKNKLMTAIICIAIIGFSACDSTDNKTADPAADTSHAQKTDHSNATKHEMNSDIMNAMNGSMERMKDMKMSADFDHDFARMMIEHHQSAIDMAQVEVSKGSDAALKQMAQNIIAAQKREIEEFKKVLNTHKAEKTNDANAGGHAGDHNELTEAMNEMMNKMKAMAMTGNIDKDFAMMMIPHHESAIKMSEDEISHGKNLQLKQMAQKIIDDQAREIKELQTWLDRNK